MFKWQNLISSAAFFVFTFAVLLILFALIRTSYLWGNIYFEQILLNLSFSPDVAQTAAGRGYIYYAFVPAFSGALVLNIAPVNRRLIFGAGLICLALCGWKFGAFRYLIDKYSPTDIYARHYVAPSDIDLQFPNKKRNIVILYLESMEQDYADSRLTGGQNLLPLLSRIQKENVSFGGFHQIFAQDYSIAAMFNSHCAIPLRFEKASDSVSMHNFLPGAVCFPQILQDNGYHTYFLKGAPLDFTRTRIFLENHGYEKFLGFDEILQQYRLDPSENGGTSWGYRDRVLYQLAQQMLTTEASRNQPFLFTMLTLDTHGPDIFLDPQCSQTQNGVPGVIKCADSMAAAFLNWLQEQPWYDNTTVIVLGDHTHTGGNPFYPQHSERKIVNIFINSAQQPETTDRQWTTIDLAPTILEAAGIRLPEGKFGLGRSLFSSTPTLIEQMGTELDNELLKSAKEYEVFKQLKYTYKPTFYPYPRWGEEISSSDAVCRYTSVSEKSFNLPWLDTLSFELGEKPTSDLTFDLTFRIVFMAEPHKQIDVVVNGEKIAQWEFSAFVEQPIRKKIRIPAALIGQDRKLLIEFKSHTAGFTFNSISLGVVKFSINRD